MSSSFLNLPHYGGSDSFKDPVATIVDLPSTDPEGSVRYVTAEQQLYIQKSTGWAVNDPATYMDEQAQDAVGAILVDTNSIVLAYDDDTPSLTATFQLSGSSISVTAGGASVPNDHTHTNKAELDIIDQDLSSTSLAEFGKVTLTTTQWNDLLPTDMQDAAGVAAPDLVALPVTSNLTAFAFAGTVTTESRCMTFEILHDYKEGTDLYPHIHWSGSDASTGAVIWSIDYSIFKSGEEQSNLVSIGTVATANPGLGANGRVKSTITEFSAISGTGLTVGTIIRARLFRNPTVAGDTYAQDALLFQVGIHYEIDTFGSNTRTAK